MPVGDVCHTKIICMLLLMLLHARACKSGETECMGSVMRICSEDGYWMETECPENTSCSKGEGSISCSIMPKRAGRGSGVGSPKRRRIQTSGDDEMDSDYSGTPDETEEPAHKGKSGVRTVTVTRSLKREHGEDRKTAEHSTSKAQSIVTITKIPNEINLEFSTSSSQGSNPLVYSVIVTTPQSAQGSHGQGAQPVSSTAPGNMGTSTPQAGIPIPTFAGSSTSTPQPSSPSSPSQTSPSPSQSPSSSQSGSSPGSPSSSPQSSPSPSQSQSGLSPGSSQSSPSQSGSSPSPSSGSSSNQSPSPSQSGSSKGQSSSSSGGQIVTAAQLTNALKTVGFTPNPSYLEAVVNGTNGHFKDKEMAAMFLAQLAHESGGFVHIEEIACKNTGCPGQYGTGAPGQTYYGRGFIQLSWASNYKEASQGLGMGDKLYQNPGLVAKDPKLAMDVSIWYWDKRVATAPGVSEKKQFGLTTKAINGELECKNNANIDKSKKRYALYKAIAKEMGVTNIASEGGCYSN